VKLALFADIHANLEALEACLAHAREQGADHHAFLGDLVGYGADPGPVVDRVAEHATRGAVVVLGNHDQAVVEDRCDTMNHLAAQAIAWTRTAISRSQRDFLAGLPLVVRQEDRVFVHATCHDPELWIYVSDSLRAARSLEAAGAAYVFSGHVHEPVLYFASLVSRPTPFRPVPGVPIPVAPRRRWLAIVGSTGQPRDGNTAACYALFDGDRATLTYFRVAYDAHAAAAKVRRAGLPPRLAHRLEYGE
jgi:diadenosine tetraphosphatase ApaH/serine/threonine PP2A family protein phosphatase